METMPYMSVEADATLVLMDEDKQIRTCLLTKKRRWSFGRETATVHPDIPVRSGIVSRDHGEFACVDGQWFYLDHGGKNGTFVNGVKAPAGRGKRLYPMLLNNGDILRVDYSDLGNPDLRAVWILFLTEKITDEHEAAEAFRRRVSMEADA